MELYTLNKAFGKQDIIEEFDSVIWTERYYGDSECEVVVPLKKTLIDKLMNGTFLAIDQSREPMIIETFEIQDGQIKVVGISILSWLNNRFVRNSVKHRKMNWKIKNQRPGELLWFIIRQMCTDKSTVIGTNNMGLGSADREKELIIPGLKLDHQDTSGKKVKKILVPYGPVYDALRTIAEQYKMGMQIWLKDDDTTLRFRSYKGLNRTSTQSTNKIIRFSPIMDSLASIHEIRSTTNFKTLVYSYASSLEKIDTADRNDIPDTWIQVDNKPGIARRTLSTGKFTGFDLRAKLILVDDIKIQNDLNERDDSGPEDTLAGVRESLMDILDHRADKELKLNNYIRTVDGEVAPTNLFLYGRDYNLGDLIEVQGNTKIVEVSRVTEYIRTQDSTGEKAYPTVVADDS
jgi:hypothetical protein